MATLTFVHSSFSGVTIEFDVSDANWRVSQVRCINSSPYPASARILKAGVQVFTAVAPAGQTTSWNTSGVQLGWQPDYYNTVTEQWEHDGLDMKDYELRVQYPSGA